MFIWFTHGGCWLQLLDKFAKKSKPLNEKWAPSDCWPVVITYESFWFSLLQTDRKQGQRGRDNTITIAEFSYSFYCVPKFRQNQHAKGEAHPGAHQVSRGPQHDTAWYNFNRILMDNNNFEVFSEISSKKCLFRLVYDNSTKRHTPFCFERKADFVYKTNRFPVSGQSHFKQNTRDFPTNRSFFLLYCIHSRSWCTRIFINDVFLRSK